jgi:hypothetical protein
MPQWAQVDGAPGRTLIYAVQRVRDEHFYNPSTDRWTKGNSAAYVPAVVLRPGAYAMLFPELEEGRDYCLHVVDKATGQRVLSQLIDWRGLPLAASLDRPPGREAPHNEYHGGFHLKKRPRRAIDLG